MQTAKGSPTAGIGEEGGTGSRKSLCIKSLRNESKGFTSAISLLEIFYFFHL